jgi:hypothetical protein
MRGYSIGVFMHKLKTQHEVEEETPFDIDPKTDEVDFIEWKEELHKDLQYFWKKMAR